MNYVVFTGLKLLRVNRRERKERREENPEEIPEGNPFFLHLGTLPGLKHFNN